MGEEVEILGAQIHTTAKAMVVGNTRIGRNGAVQPFLLLLFQHNVDDPCRSLSFVLRPGIGNDLHLLDHIGSDGSKGISLGIGKHGWFAVDENLYTRVSSQTHLSFDVYIDGRHIIQQFQRPHTRGADILAHIEYALVELEFHLRLFAYYLYFVETRRR